jgi:hypothetical protein
MLGSHPSIRQTNLTMHCPSWLVSPCPPDFPRPAPPRHRNPPHHAASLVHPSIIRGRAATRNHSRTCVVVLRDLYSLAVQLRTNKQSCCWLCSSRPGPAAQIICADSEIVLPTCHDRGHIKIGAGRVKQGGISHHAMSKKDKR